MKYAIEIDNLNYNYKNKNLFKNVNIKIEQGSFITIFGCCNSGKTTLYNILKGDLKITSKIKFSSNLNDIAFINNENKNSICKTVLEKLTFQLEKNNIDNTDISKKIMEIANYFQIYNLLDKDMSSLSSVENILIEFVSKTITQPKIIIIDGCLSCLDINNKNRIIKYLLKLKQNNNVTIINLTKNTEEIFYSDKCIIIDDNKTLIEYSNEEIFNNTQILKSANLKIPFILEVSDKLNAYELIDKPIIDINNLIDTIWK